MFSQPNWQARKHWIPKRKFLPQLRFLVGTHSPWTQELGVQSTVLLLGLQHRHSKPWGAQQGSHTKLWFLTSKGAGACKGAELHEQFTTRWISLQHC